MSQPIHLHSHGLGCLSISFLTMVTCVLLWKAQHLHVLSICVKDMLAKDNKHQCLVQSMTFAVVFATILWLCWQPEL